MPSVFDIFGEINLESRAFQGSLRAVAGRLQATDKALDQTIAKSNRLGDTSATVARRYEKLGESIQMQRQRLLDNALAFEKGEITAKKFASVVTSVDRATLSLNSRLKDAKARLTELSETNLTHFQQQIQGAVAPQQGGLDINRGFLRNLSRYQTTQLSFQINDIISGLAMGQSPLQILTQQGGQIVQIFQMGKKAQEGTAAATAAAAASEAAFAASAKGAAVSQAQVAVSSEATAAAMTTASASSTILGASVVSLGATLAAGLVSIAAAYKITKDIRMEAEKRLKNEEAITAEFNKQNQLLGELKKRLETEAKGRAFSAFAGGEDIFGLQFGLAARQRERASIAQAISDEQRRRNALLTTLPLLGKDFLAGAASPEQTARIKQLDDEISTLTARVAELRKESADSFKEFVQGIPERAAKANETRLKQMADAEKELAKKRKQMVDEAIKKAKEWAAHVKNAIKEVQSIVTGTTTNPFVKIFLDGEQAIRQMTEATKGLGSELQNNLRRLIESDTAAKAFKQSMDNALKAVALRGEAAAFLGRPAPTASEALQRQLDAIGAGSRFAGGQSFNIGANGAIGSLINNIDPNQRARDQRLIEITKGLSDADLTPAQKQAAAAARLREANALEQEKPEALEIQKQTLEVLKQLNGNKALEIEITDDNNRTSIRSTSANVNARYTQ